MNETVLKQVYAWVDSFALSRLKRNIGRDFADGVLVAEIIGAKDPSLIEVHNYSPTNNARGKIQNWQLLNKKVLKRLEIQADDREIEAITEGKPFAIEQFLARLKSALDRREATRLQQQAMRRISEAEQEEKPKGLSSQIKLVKEAQHTNHVATIQNLMEAVELLTKKVEKMQQMLDLKDQKIAVLERAVAQQRP